MIAVKHATGSTLRMRWWCKRSRFMMRLSLSPQVVVGRIESLSLVDQPAADKRLLDR